VCFGFLLAGRFWPMLYPDLLVRVNAAWHRLRRTQIA
jgi:hypothetical protein